MSVEISVIIPVYNAENYLHECINSVVRQTHKDCEILLIDDGSTDGSGQICDEFQEKFDGVRVIHQKNAGVSVARNMGLQHAEGNYVTFVDADDRLEPDCLDALTSVMRPGGMAVGGVFRSSNIIHSSYSENPICYDKEQAELSVLSHNGIQGYSWGKLYDIKLIRQNNITFDPEISIREDMLFVIQYISCTTQPVMWIKKPIYYYRPNPNGALSKRFIEHNIFDVRLLSEITALERAEICAEQTPRLRHAFQLIKAKASVTVLRAMLAGGYNDFKLYNALLRYARKRCIPVLLSNICAQSAKVSVFLSSVNPRLEYFIWRHFADKK